MAAVKGKADKPPAEKRKRKPLGIFTDRHELFCLELIKRGLRDQAGAYIAAGFGAQGAKQSASRLFNEPVIQARIKELMSERFKRLHMEVDEVLARAAMIARSSVHGLYDDKGNLLSPHELDMEAAAAVAGVEVYEEFSGTGKSRVKVGETRKVRLRDPMPALRLLAEHKKLVKSPDEGVNALASAIADRLKAKREQKRKEQKP
jgi:phage terminase small subunit